MISTQCYISCMYITVVLDTGQMPGFIVAVWLMIWLHVTVTMHDDERKPVPEGY